MHTHKLDVQEQALRQFESIQEMYIREYVCLYIHQEHPHMQKEEERESGRDGGVGGREGGRKEGRERERERERERNHVKEDLP